MKKGVAVPYIIAIILGIVVLGLIGWWLFKGGGQIGGKISEAECMEKQIIYCSKWQLKNFAADNPPSGDDAWDKLAKGCSGIGIKAPTITRCKTLLGIS